MFSVIDKIKSIIDIRNCWKDGEETKLVSDQENIVYDYNGTVFCICLATGEQREMAYGTLKFVQSGFNLVEQWFLKKIVEL